MQSHPFFGTTHVHRDLQHHHNMVKAAKIVLMTRGGLQDVADLGVGLKDGVVLERFLLQTEISANRGSTARSNRSLWP